MTIDNALSNPASEHPISAGKLMMTVDNLSITTESGGVLVDQLSYELHQGQTLAIVGESGSGKSIASLALLGLLPSSLLVSGDVQLLNAAGMSALPITNSNARNNNARNIDKRNIALRPIRGKRIGMVFKSQ